MTEISIWKIPAGVAFFLLAMNMLEAAMQQLSGRKFKLLLKKQTGSKLKAIAGGAAITGLLQSSSVVNLLVIGMAGRGIVKMENALSLMLGANLGTTLDTWILALFGFNYNISNVVLPVAGVAGIIMAFALTNSKLQAWCRLLFSISFLFIALGFIKNGMEGFVKQTDLSFYSSYPLIIFLMIGIVITSLVQSSSVTAAIALSALYSNAISVYMASAIVLGAEIGTTFKLFLASAKSPAIKKRLALANFIFNIATVAVMFPLLKPAISFITDIINIQDKLVVLVCFQTMANFFCIMIFVPFLQPFGKFLMKRFSDKDDESFYIRHVAVDNAALALDALEKETTQFFKTVIHFCRKSYGLNSNEENIPSEPKFATEEYTGIKHLHGEMQAYCMKLQAVAGTEEKQRAEKIISSIRNALYAAKSMGDAEEDIRQTSSSSNDVKYNFYVETGSKLSRLYAMMGNIIENGIGKSHFEEFDKIYSEITANYSENLQVLYKKNLHASLSETEISMLINFNREIHTSLKSLLFGLKDFLLPAAAAEYFDSRPGFIR